jgi:hypothetical protein
LRASTCFTILPFSRSAIGLSGFAVAKHQVEFSHQLKCHDGGSVKFGKLIGFIIIGCLTGGLAIAQVTTGTISGTVTDNTGAALPDSKVVVLNEGTGITRTLTTNEFGRFSAPSLPPGRYRVTSSHAGFGDYVRNGIVLAVGQDAVVDMSLGVGAQEQAVEVHGEAPAVETTNASLSSLVDERAIRTLPLNGRSYDQLALLQPGVTTSSPGQTGGAPYSFGTGKRFNVGGQRGTSNTFLLDGTTINDQGNGTPGGAAGTNLGVDTILEFKIFTNSFKAEFGRSGGSVTTAVTRSGSNDFHGTIFEYIRNSALDAKNYFDLGNSPAPFRRNQFGGVIGGPIVKNKTFFFAGYEGLRQGLSTNQTAIVPTADARNGILPSGNITVSPKMVPYLNLYPLPNGRTFTDGTAEYRSNPLSITNEDNVMGRVDHQLTAGTNIFGRYTFDTDSSTLPSSLPMLTTELQSRRQYATVQANSTFGPQVVNNFRFGFNRSWSTFNPVITGVDPSLSIIPGQDLGTLQIGAIIQPGAKAVTPLGSPNSGSSIRSWAYNTFEWADDLTLVSGKHTYKAGVDVQRIQDNTALGNFVRGSYNFSTFENFLKGIPSNLQAAAPVGVLPTWGLRQTIFALYGQDDWAIHPRLTLNLGLRWERASDPTDTKGQASILKNLSDAQMTLTNRFFEIGKKNLEPRAGLSWQATKSGKTVVRAAAGIYHNQILPWAYSLNIANPPFYGRFSATNPPFPNGYTVLKPGATVNLATFNELQKTPTSYQWNASVQQELFKETVLEVRYAGNRGRHLQTEREANTRVPTFLNGDPTTPFYAASGPRINPAWGSIVYLDMNGNSQYDAGTVMLRKQSSKGFIGQIFYTYAKAMDINSGISGSDSVRSPQAVMNPYNQAADYGLADFDERHHVGFNFSYPLPVHVNSKVLGVFANGWALDGVGQFASGMPFTARLSTPVSRDQASVAAERPTLLSGFSTNPSHGVSAGCTGIAAGTPLGTPTNWFDPCAFVAPAAGTYGNLGRNTIIGPGIQNIDMALSKVFKPTERLNVTFRAEMFNIFNHANFGLPNTVALNSSGNPNPSAGLISYTTTSARQLQFAIRLSF